MRREQETTRKAVKIQATAARHIICLCLVMMLILVCGCTDNTALQSGPYGYEEIEFCVPSDDSAKDDIYGIFYIPENAGQKLPAIIFSHGYGGTHKVGEPYAKALAKQGYAVYCFDFRGGSPHSRSGGSVLEMSVFTELDDLEQVLDYVEKQDFVDDESIFLMGTSQGGAVSAMAASRHKDSIRGMVLLYPAFVLPDRAEELFGEAENIPQTYTFLGMEVGKVYFESLIDYDIYSDISSYDKDVLIIHGTADKVVPISCAEKALETYPAAELIRIQGAGHGFSGDDRNTVIKYVSEYLNAQMKQEK